MTVLPNDQSLAMLVFVLPWLMIFSQPIQTVVAKTATPRASLQELHDLTMQSFKIPWHVSVPAL